MASGSMVGTGTHWTISAYAISCTRNAGIQTQGQPELCLNDDAYILQRSAMYYESNDAQNEVRHR